MTFDIAHMIATALIIFVVVWGLDQTTVLDNMPKRRKTLVKFGALFVSIFILNLAWPAALIST
jgi:hypothetical protein